MLLSHWNKCSLCPLSHLLHLKSNLCRPFNLAFKTSLLFQVTHPSLKLKCLSARPDALMGTAYLGAQCLVESTQWIMLECTWVSDSFFLFFSFSFSFQLTGEAILQIASKPVLPFNALDIALEVQKNLQGNFCRDLRNFSKCNAFPLLEMASSCFSLL